MIHLHRFTRTLFAQQWPSNLADLPDDVLLYTPGIAKAAAVIFWFVGVLASIPYILEHGDDSRLVLIRVVAVAWSSLTVLLTMRYVDRYYRACVVLGGLSGITGTLVTVAYMNGVDINPHAMLVAVYVVGVGFAIGRAGVIIATAWIAVNYGLIYLADQLGWWPRPQVVAVADIRHDNVSALFFVLLVLIPLLLGYLVLVKRSLVELKHLAAKQRENDRALVAQLEAQSAQIGRDLHDGAMNDGTVAQRVIELCQYLLDDGDVAAVREQLDKLTQVLDHQATSLRYLLNQLRPIELANRGLEEAIRLQQHRLNPELNVTIKDEIGGLLDPDLEVIIYYLVREALANTNDHARARHASIDLRAQPERNTVYLEVRDDGCGFDPGAGLQAAQLAGHHGLSNMRERVALLGGTLNIESRPDHGTVLCITLPLHAAGSGKSVTLERVAG